MRDKVKLRIMDKMLKAEEAGKLSYCLTDEARFHDRKTSLERISQSFYFKVGKLGIAVMSQRGAIKQTVG